LPESGQTNQLCYLSAADALLRTASDAPTVGLLLCESRGKSIVEYALRDVAKPIGVSTYRVTRQLPEPLRDEIPSIEDLQGVVEKLRSDLKERKTTRSFPFLILKTNNRLFAERVASSTLAVFRNEPACRSRSD
jgi:hypothetical protein